ncbi:hypothetical protein ZWY2020_057660 [Hordeum vulgare]|nr:hypothetical protein ZWY2020_057660 [Hordeum vulgare]
MVATFINEAKWKEKQAKQAKAANIKKEKFLKQNLLKGTPKALVSTQDELKTLTDKYTSLHTDREGVMVNFIKVASAAVDEYNNRMAPPKRQEAPQSSYIVQLPEEDETDEPAAEEIPQDIPAEENAPADETARPDTAPVPEETAPSPQPSKMKKVTPSASDVKKTKAAEKEAKKRTA